MLGRKRYEGELLNGLENVVDLAKFASGMYVYQVFCDNAVAKTGKILVEK